MKTHRDLRGRVMLPVHWGTFNLAFHTWRDPVDRAVAAATKNDVRIVVPRPGEFVEPSKLTTLQRWWNQL